MAESNDNEALIVRATKGDRIALELLLVEYHSQLERRIEPQLTGHLQRLLGVDDIIQETFIRAIRDIKKCKAQTEASFVAWLNTLCDNQLLDSIRRLQRIKRGGELRQIERISGDRASSMLNLFDVLMAESHTPESSVAKHEAVYAIQVGIADLPDDQRQAIQLHCLEGKSLSEVADEMKRSSDAVRALVRRGKSALSKALIRSTLWLSKK